MSSCESLGRTSLAEVDLRWLLLTNVEILCRIQQLNSGLIIPEPPKLRRKNRKAQRICSVRVIFLNSNTNNGPSYYFEREIIALTENIFPSYYQDAALHTNYTYIFPTYTPTILFIRKYYVFKKPLCSCNETRDTIHHPEVIPNESRVMVKQNSAVPIEADPLPNKDLTSQTQQPSHCS